MVISIIITNFIVSKVFIDQGSSTNILYWKTFQRLEISPDTIQPHVGSLLGFAGKRLETKGYVDLMSTFGQGQLSRNFTIGYLIIDANTSYFAFIGKNVDLFAWQPSEMQGIHPSIICHKLAICPQAKLVSQKKRKMGDKWRKVVREEVDKLLKANFIREVKYST